MRTKTSSLKKRNLGYYPIQENKSRIKTKLIRGRRIDAKELDTTKHTLDRSLAMSKSKVTRSNEILSVTAAL